MQDLAAGQGNAVVGDLGPRKNSGSHIDASHSRQPLVKGERLVRYEVNPVMCINACDPCLKDSLKTNSALSKRTDKLRMNRKLLSDAWVVYPDAFL